MKKLFVFSIISICGFGQNLVQNPSFEDYDSCPTMEINTILFNFVPFWEDIGMTAYFNRCSNDNFGVPNNMPVFSFQETNSGDAYAGNTTTNNFGINVRDYLQNTLSQALIINKCYYVEFYTNLLNNVMYATNNLGLYFTNTSNIPLKPGYEYLLEGSPQIYKFGNPVITDTMNWVKVAGIYEAQGGEQFLTIGNFSTDEETDTMIFDPNAYDAAFYYIDDVSVIPIDASSMPANAGEDKIILQAESVFIGQEITNLNCTWSKLDGTIVGTNTSGLFVTPTETTTYVCEQNLCGTITYDTVVVKISGLGIPHLDGYKVERFSIFPNPTKNTLSISSELFTGNEVFEVSTLEGRIVLNAQSNEKIDVSSLQNGTYFITTEINGEKIAQKFIKE